MDPKVKTGISVAQKGMQAAKVGRKALDMKKKLPGAKKKAAAKAAQKAVKAAFKTEQKQSRKIRNKKAVRNGKGIGRVALAIWNRYF